MKLLTLPSLLQLLMVRQTAPNMHNHFFSDLAGEHLRSAYFKQSFRTSCFFKMWKKMLFEVFLKFEMPSYIIAGKLIVVIMKSWNFATRFILHGQKWYGVYVCALYRWQVVIVVVVKGSIWGVIEFIEIRGFNETTCILFTSITRCGATDLCVICRWLWNVFWADSFVSGMYNLIFLL